MTLREEVLNEAVKVISQEEVSAADNALNCLVKYFNLIGQAESANVLKNLKSRPAGVRIHYMKKMADMIKQYKNEV